MTINDTYGGKFYLMKKTVDGNLLMKGSNFITSVELFSKIDSAGNLSFSKILSMPSGFSLSNMISTSTGYLLLFAGGGVKIFLVATDFNGNFQSISGYNISGNFGGVDFYQNPDGSLIIAGISGGSFATGALILKIDSVGTVLWNKKFTNASYFRQIDRIVDDGVRGFYLFGSVYDTSFYFNKAFVAKCDTAGNMLWNKMYNVKVGNFLSVDRTIDNGFVLSSNFEQGQVKSTVVLKIDTGGTQQWNKIYSDPMGDNVEGVDVKTVFNKGFIITGNYGPSNPAARAFLIRTDTLGNILWSFKYEGVISEDIMNVCVMNDSGFAFGGTTNGFSISTMLTTGYLGKTDSAGRVGCFEQSISIDTSSIVIMESSATFTVSSFTFSNQVPAYPSVLNDIGHYVCSTLSIPETVIKSFIHFVPNPVTTKSFLRLNFTPVEEYGLIIYNPLGKIMSSQSIKMDETEIDFSRYPNGIYYFLLISRINSFNGKIVVGH
jgi:hypothetical protein